MPLLSRDERPPYFVVNPGAASPLLLVGDHSGAAIPASLDRLGLPASALERHIALDIGVAALGARLAEALGATFIAQRFSRLVIDCNRDPSVPSAMPEVSETTPIPGNVGLSAVDRAARVAAIFTPYHTRIAALLDARAAAGRRTVFVAMHSFTPVFKGESRAVQVGVLFNRDVRLAEALLHLLRAEGDIVVGENAPYAVSDTSDYGVPVHGEQRGLPHVEVEIRQDLIADAAGQAAWAARFARLLPAADALMRGRG